MEESLVGFPCAVTSYHDKLDPQLVCYLRQQEIATADFDHRTKKYVHVTLHGCKRYCAGLLTYLARQYLPEEYERPKRKRSRKIVYKKKSGSDRVGRGVMTGIEEYVENGNVIPESYAHPRSKTGIRILGFLTAIINWLETRGYTLQAAEVPVLFPRLGRMTRADLITKNRLGTGLVVWEIKCGWPACATTHKLRLKAPLEKVSCAAFNQYYLQAIYTDAGMRKQGLHADSVKILHCWEEAVDYSGKKKRKIEENGKTSEEVEIEQIVYKVEARDMPRWALDLRESIISSL